VKIDRSFIEHIDENQVETRIVSGIIDLCHALGIKVIAEGIESARQFAALRDLGADFGQRYYFTELLAPGETGGIDVTSFGCERS
jgi:EAL domain-containing protein (putative c-di-GMP-specific phosphodiesterase class I)